MPGRLLLGGVLMMSTVRLARMRNTREMHGMTVTADRKRHTRLHADRGDALGGQGQRQQAEQQDAKRTARHRIPGRQ